MTSVRVTSTADIDLGALHTIADELEPSLSVEVSDRQIFLKSAEPPSWILFLADAPWWLQVFSAYAALYVAELVKEAAKSTWQARAEIAAGLATASRGVLSTFASSLGKLRDQIAGRTNLLIGLPFPEDYFSTRLKIEGETPAEFEAQIALFVHHLPALLELIESEGLSEATVAGGVSLRLLDDGALEVRWQDSTVHDVRTRVLPLDAA